MTDTAHTPLPWSADEYDSSGGYDCMTGGFHIKDANGKLVLTIDQAIFGQNANGSDEREYPEAKSLTDLIVKAVNEYPKHAMNLSNCGYLADGYRDERDELRKINAELVEALKFYADQSKWLEVERVTGDDGKQYDMPPLILLDSGSVAQSALAKAGVK